MAVQDQESKPWNPVSRNLCHAQFILWNIVKLLSWRKLLYCQYAGFSESLISYTFSQTVSLLVVADVLSSLLSCRPLHNWRSIIIKWTLCLHGWLLELPISFGDTCWQPGRQFCPFLSRELTLSLRHMLLVYLVQLQSLSIEIIVLNNVRRVHLSQLDFNFQSTPCIVDSGIKQHGCDIRSMSTRSREPTLCTLTSCLLFHWSSVFCYWYLQVSCPASLSAVVYITTYCTHTFMLKLQDYLYVT